MRPAREEKSLRVIGGSLRGRKLTYLVDRRTRPMKDRTREAVFNILGDRVKGLHVLDLFTGTGALAIEALSRGAASAVLSERHAPTASVVVQNLRTLGLSEIAQVRSVDAFRLGPRILAEMPTPRLVIVCPPYAFYEDDPPRFARFLSYLAEQSPPETCFIIEATRPLGPTTDGPGAIPLDPPPSSAGTDSPETDSPETDSSKAASSDADLGTTNSAETDLATASSTTPSSDTPSSDPIGAVFQSGGLSAAQGWRWRWRAYAPAVLGVGERLPS